jgi:hypothetical protein
MSLTSAQLTMLASTITGDATLNALAAVNGFPQIAAALNLDSAPVVTVFNPSVTTAKIQTAILAADMPTTAALIGWLQMMLSTGTVDGSNANIRSGFSTCFTGKTSLTNLTAIAQRTATRFEALFTTSNICPLFGYNVSAADVQQALGK